MKRYILTALLSCLTLCSQKANSVEIVYPKSNNLKIIAVLRYIMGHKDF